MREKALHSGVLFRPHVKTHKTIEIGRLQHGGGPGPITVSTLAEAEAFARAGFEDITYAVPIAPDKLDRCAQLARTVRRLNLLIDHPVALDAIEAFARSHSTQFDVFLKIDSGYHRAGVDPARDESIELAQRLGRSKTVRFHGLLTHAGHSYGSRNKEEIGEVAREETRAVTEFRDRLGNPTLIRSIGSTPTASVVDRFTECDEVRPGNYVFYDAFQATVGSCSFEDCAMSVLATVIGAYPQQNKLLIDAGALALSKDLGPTQIDPSFGYGLVCDENLERLPIRVTSVSQEHGQLIGDQAIDFARFTVGTKLRIVPNHSCLTAAMYDVFHVIEKRRVVNEWRPMRGW